MKTHPRPALLLPLALTLLTGLCGSVAQAEDHALIVNLSQYSDPRANLSGIENDIPLMKEVLDKLSFKPTQIKTLSNAQATRKGILEGVEGWLIAGVKPEDRVVVYYNGHGGQVKDVSGDEADGCDEVLIPYDLDNPILDDEIQVLLQRIPAEQVLVILDSCFSGTATKAKGFKGPSSQVKFFKSKTLTCNQAVNYPQSQSLGKATPPSLERSRPYLELSAAAENEVAWGSVLQNKPGSMFTVALHTRMMDTPGPVSFQQLRDYTARYMAELSSMAGVLPSHPQLSGPAEWLGQDITAFGRLTSPDAGVLASSDGNTLYQRLLAQSQFEVTLMGEARYAVNQKATFEVKSDRAGYLSLLELDAAGQLTVLFPNAFDQENAIGAGQTLSLPGRAFRIEIGAPRGESRFLALVTPQPLNLGDVKGELLNRKGGFVAGDSVQTLHALVRRVGHSLRPLGVLKQPLEFGAGLWTVTIE